MKKTFSILLFLLTFTVFAQIDRSREKGDALDARALLAYYNLEQYPWHWRLVKPLHNGLRHDRHLLWGLVLLRHNVYPMAY